MGHCKHRLLVEHPSQPEVTQLCLLTGVQKDVTWFKVPVEDFLWSITLSGLSISSVDLRCLLASVAEIKSTDNLRKNLPYEFFTYEVFGLNTTTDNFLEVAALAVLHNDEDLKVALVHNAVVIANDVWVAQFPQNVDF